MGIKGEMSGTVCVTFTWDMYIWVVYSFCLVCYLFIIVTWWYVWCIVWANGMVAWGQFNSGIGIAAQFQFVLGNWNWNWNWNWRNWKWNWNWKLWNWNWKPELNFLQQLPQNLLVHQQFPNFSFNRGHNLPCDWLLMQQGCFKFLEHCPPVVWSQNILWIINQNRNACT